MTDWEERVNNLVAWLQEGGSFVSPNLAIKTHPETGRSLWITGMCGEDERLISIKHKHTLNILTVREHIAASSNPLYVSLRESEGYTELTSFQLIPLYICLERARGANSFWWPFLRCMPEIEEFEGMPVTWIHDNAKDEYWKLLPKWSRDHSRSQLEKLTEDWLTVSRMAKHVQRKEFLWAWLCCNTRCLYSSLPSDSEPLSRENSLAMVPLVDFMNHSFEETVRPQDPPSSEDDWEVVSLRHLEAQEEVLFAYHADSDEFFLCEYGFMLNENQYNYTQLDSVFGQLFKPEQIEFLEENDYLGDYKVYCDEVSFRTEVALAALQERQDFSRVVQLMLGEKNVYSKQSSLLLKRILAKYASWVKAQIETAQALEKSNKRAIIVQAYENLLKVIKHHL